MNPSAKIEDIDADEQQLCKIRKHPFGLFSVYFGIIVGIGVVVAIMFLVLPGVLTTVDKNSLTGYVMAGTLVLAAMASVGLIIFTFIYNGSYLIITSRNVTQVLQQGLFGRKVSELSLANVEDVTSIKRGVFATIFNFGKLRIETAGEMENFDFPYCPQPNYYGKIILDARRQFVQDNPDRREMREQYQTPPPVQPAVPSAYTPPAAPPTSPS